MGGGDAWEDTLQQEPRQQPTDEVAAPKDLSLCAVSAILAAVDNLKSVIAEQEVRILSV